jgi:predicted ester cyclase
LAEAALETVMMYGSVEHPLAHNGTSAATPLCGDSTHVREPRPYTDPNGWKADSMATESTSTAATLMGRAFDAIAAHDLDRLAEVWDERSTDVFVALNLTVTGESDLRLFFGRLFTALPDLEFATEDVHAVSDEVAVGQWQMSGTFSGGPFQGIEPTGKHIELRGIDVMRFEGEKLRHNDIYYDGLSFARQIGMLPATDSAGDRALTATFNAAVKARKAVRDRLSH